MNTKKYPIIPVEDGYVIVDKGDLQVWRDCENSISKSWPDSSPILAQNAGWGQNQTLPIIAHTGIPSLKDSGLPLFRIPVTNVKEYKSLISLAEGYASAYSGRPEFNHRKFGWLDGYKAAGSYTEEDMIYAINIACADVQKNGLGMHSILVSKAADLWINKIKPKLKKHPTAVVVEMEYYSKPEDGHSAVHKEVRPKVVNGYIQIKEVLYE